MKTNVIFECSDQQYSDWKKGDKGFIDGYLANDGVPYMIVINLRTKRPVMVTFGGVIKVIK